MLAISLKVAAVNLAALLLGSVLLGSLVVCDVLQQRAEGLWHCLSYSWLPSQMKPALSFMELLHMVAESWLCAQMASSCPA